MSCYTERGTHSERRTSDPLSTPPVDDQTETEIGGIDKSHAAVERLVEVARVLHLCNDGDEGRGTGGRDEDGS